MKHTILHSSLITIVLLISSFCISIAQTDSAEYEIYDIIYLEKGGGIKGELIAFDEIDGGVVFKDIHGRTYSLAREEYKYFIEDKKFKVKGKKNREINPRKKDEWEVSIGFSGAFLNLSHQFEADEYYLNGVDALADLPVCLKIGAGKYLNRSNYIGLTSEIALLSQNPKYYNIGLRYFHQYDGQTGNIALYIPVELQFQNMNVISGFSVNDTVFTNGGFDFPRYTDLTSSVQSFSLSAGHGISFIMKNKKSVSIELSILKHFVISNNFIDLDREEPNSVFNTAGAKLSVLFNI